jgi:hypothetical protein
VGVKVTLVGGGGGGGAVSGPSGTGGAGGGGGGQTAIMYIPAASIPGPVSVFVGSGGSRSPTVSDSFATSGGPSVFGAIFSASGGSASRATGGAFVTQGGTGGDSGSGPSSVLFIPGTPGTPGIRGSDSGYGGAGGGTYISGSSQGGYATAPGAGVIQAPNVPSNYRGTGGGGAAKIGPTGFSGDGADGRPGIVIIEEFY